MINKVHVPAQSGNSLDKVRICETSSLVNGKMEWELVSTCKNGTQLLLPTNKAPTILDFFLSDTSHNSRNRMYMYHRDESSLFFLFIYLFLVSWLERERERDRLIGILQRTWLMLYFALIVNLWFCKKQTTFGFILLCIYTFISIPVKIFLWETTSHIHQYTWLVFPKHLKR